MAADSFSGSGTGSRKLSGRTVPGLFFILMLLAFSQATAVGKTFHVRSGYDVTDLTPGNGLCVAYIIINPPYVLPFCTLRAAIQETNALPGEDVVILPSGTFHLTLEGTQEDLSASGDLDITDDLTIIGAGSDQTFISADELDRVLDVIAPGITVTITGVSFINGKLPAGLPQEQAGGAGIRNLADLTLSKCGVSSNTLAGTAGEDSGAAIANHGLCKLYYSTLNANTAENEGGALFNSLEGRLLVYASTIHHNQAATGGGMSNYGAASLLNMTISKNKAADAAGEGAGVVNHGNLVITQSTIAGNTAPQGGGIANNATLALTNTLFNDNPGGNCTGSGEILSAGGNLDDNGSCAMVLQETDLVDIDPRLQPLGNNGGLTPTHRIYYSSPARDKALTIPSLTRDQCGHSRTVDKGYDIGAFEASLAIAPLLDRLLLKKERVPLE